MATDDMLEEIALKYAVQQYVGWDINVYAPLEVVNMLMNYEFDDVMWQHNKDCKSGDIWVVFSDSCGIDHADVADNIEQTKAFYKVLLLEGYKLALEENK
jgi:hypothetical protein